jgi:hypothetical protein
MGRQIGGHFQEPSMIVMEMRLRRLEDQVATLTTAIRVLAHSLEDGPLAEPGKRQVAEAARQAHDLLLLVKPRAPAVQPSAQK